MPPMALFEQADLVWCCDDRHRVKNGQELIDGKLRIVMRPPWASTPGLRPQAVR